MEKLAIKIPESEDLRKLKREMFENQSCWSIIEMLGRQNPIPEGLLEKYRALYAEGQITSEELRQNILHDNRPDGFTIRRFNVDLARDELMLCGERGETK